MPLYAYIHKTKKSAIRFVPSDESNKIYHGPGKTFSDDTKGLMINVFILYLQRGESTLICLDIGFGNESSPRQFSTSTIVKTF